MEKYKQAGLPIKERVQDLLSRMTLREKVGQLNQRMYGWDAYKMENGELRITDAFKDEVEAYGGMGALYGLFRSDPWSGVDYSNGITAEKSAAAANQIQRYVIEHSRLGIPVLLTEECPHGHQALDGTMLPVNLGAGSTWNPELLEEAYGRVAAEIRSRGAHIGLVSALDILHDPRWGRSEECYSEDPYLAAAFTTAAVRGMQGTDAEKLDGPDRIAVVLKHLCAQGAGQGGRNAGPAEIGERELREIHLPAARAGAAAGAAGFMAAYNEIDGVPCHANDKLLTGMLREEWGFDGIVMADGQAVDRLLALTGSHEGAGALALTSGVDLSLWDKAFTTLEEAAARGLVSEADIDRAVVRVLTLKFRLGLFDRPYADEQRPLDIVGSDRMRRLNLQVARESVVLLKNEDELLPLRADKQRRIAVIGPNADRLYNQLGDYTSVQRKGRGTTVLEGIRQAAPSGVQVVYALGCGIRDTSDAGFAAAVELAAGADAAVLVLGGSSARQFGGDFDGNGEAVISEGSPSDMDCGEGVDLADLRPGGLQLRLAEAVAATGTPVVAVMIQGRPLELTELEPLADALLCAWYPGMEGGLAVGEILFGQVNPSGRLPVSLPRSAAQLPVYYNQKAAHRLRNYIDMPSAPLYPFGYGLSYTRFAYSELTLSQTSVSAAELAAGSTVQVSVKVKNTGAVRGAETVQLYIRALESGITRRVAELKGFRKVSLLPGEEQIVVLELGHDELAVWNRSMAFAAEPCRVEVKVGGSVTGTLSAELSVVRSFTI
ncbi:glycoside hydrolase family 3 C-terminal domain-containing protein [Paenibacillus doosanensis]|uniref:glycoside hydrolase family 3 N-terminal domain-containing protein n=1 Tax=Paenibacillus doosanensis TaxID=1229154 RepID=UPI0021801B00|nr:glycoside hydrolase family 3 N-terminal domain-containing protein [Paenibacillus doosanensis]MCS7460665.1 glycoside hydrolase family 3 C-terminal domain-containing protein [Paenibacillus doosanensis]